MGVRNRVGIGFSYRPARLHSLAELNPWNRFLGSFKSLEIRALHRFYSTPWRENAGVSVPEQFTKLSYVYTVLLTASQFIVTGKLFILIDRVEN